MILLLNALVFDNRSAISLSSLKRLISSSRLLNKNASFSCTSLFFSAETKTCQVYHSQVIQQSHLLFAPFFFSAKFNIAGIMVINISCKSVMNFISYFHVKSCCSFMKLFFWALSKYIYSIR